MNKKRLSEAQILLIDHLSAIWREADISAEYPFALSTTGRKWRFDVAVLDTGPGGQEFIGFEIDGGAWSQGRHTRGAGFIKDMEKLNTASALGWKIFRFTPQQVLNGEAKAFIEKYLGKDTQP